MRRYDFPCFCWLCLLLVLLPQVVLAQHKPRSLYDGNKTEFEQALFLKPRENTNYSRAYDLAPLIIQEVLGDKPVAVPMKVHFLPGSVELNGISHTQMTYWWQFIDRSKEVPNRLQDGTRREPVFKGGAQFLRYSVKPVPHRSSSAASSKDSPAMGIRLTMSTNGMPEIYEVLGGVGSIRQIFVTRSLEKAAKAKFGPPMLGRKHVIEPELKQAPDVVVPRIIDDPPEPMGPFLYLRAGDHALATLICRCMDAQAKELVGQGLYELVPAGFSGDDSPATRPDAANPRGLPKDFINSSNRLSQSLRLPGDF